MVTLNSDINRKCYYLSSSVVVVVYQVSLLIIILGMLMLESFLICCICQPLLFGMKWVFGNLDLQMLRLKLNTYE